MKEVFSRKKVIKYISCIGILILLSLYIYWIFTNTENTLPYYAVAFFSVVLSGIVFLQFVPEWVNFWSREDMPIKNGLQTDKKQSALLAVIFCAVIAVVFVTVHIMLKAFKLDTSLSFWLCTDSIHYMDIARDWYLRVGIKDRLVQLVFFPGYPILVRIVKTIIGDYLISGLIVSSASLIASGIMFYKLLKLDYADKQAMRTIKYLCICPSIFFYVAPMSDSLFLLLCVSCLYCVRTKKIWLGCFLGGLAAFTRSLGITLVVPVFFEIIHDLVNNEAATIKEWCKKMLPILLIPLGIIAYLCINYSVSKNPFQFMIYQKEHWGQNFGLYFETAARYFSYILKCIKGNYPETLYGRIIPNILSCFIPLVLMIFSAKKMRTSYVAWFISYYIIAIGSTALLSGPRYEMSCFPLFIALGSISKNKIVNIILTVLSVLAFFMYTAAFVQRWSVW